MSAVNTVSSQSVQTLYNDHHHWLRGWLRLKLGCAHQAADLAQDVFVRVMSASHGHEIREPRAYLSTIAHGLVVNHWRRLEIERAYLEALAQLPEQSIPSEEHRLIVLQALFEIDALLTHLPANVREAFLLSQLEGLKYAEIALRLKVSERMVKKYMAQAMLCCLEHMP